VIKRRPCLSAALGGTVTEVVGDSGKPKKITTHCRMYQKMPHVHGLLCEGLDDYPPCPDLELCRGLRKTHQTGE